MGVFRWESSRVSVMMVKFPVMLSIYVRNRKKKITTWSSGSSVRPRRMKYVTEVLFLISDGLSIANLIDKFNTENMETQTWVTTSEASLSLSLSLSLSVCVCVCLCVSATLSLCPPSFCILYCLHLIISLKIHFPYLKEEYCMLLFCNYYFDILLNLQIEYTFF